MRSPLCEHIRTYTHTRINVAQAGCTHQFLKVSTHIYTYIHTVGSSRMHPFACRLLICTHQFFESIYIHIYIYTYSWFKQDASVRLWTAYFGIIRAYHSSEELCCTPRKWIALFSLSISVSLSLCVCVCARFYLTAAKSSAVHHVSGSHCSLSMYVCLCLCLCLCMCVCVCVCPYVLHKRRALLYTT
jgi:hypothetical protein